MKTYYENIHTAGNTSNLHSESHWCSIHMLWHQHASCTFAIVLKAVPSTLLFFIRHGQAQSARSPGVWPHGPQCSLAALFWCVWSSKCLLWLLVNSCLHWSHWSLDLFGVFGWAHVSWPHYFHQRNCCSQFLCQQEKQASKKNGNLLMLNIVLSYYHPFISLAVFCFHSQSILVILRVCMFCTLHAMFQWGSPVPDFSRVQICFQTWAKMPPG